MAAAAAAMSAWVTEVVAAVVGTNQVRPKCTPFPREYDFYKKRNHTMHGRRLWLNHTIWMAKITSAAKSDVHPHVVYSWRRKMGTGLA